MVFSTHIFIFYFLPIALFLYYITPTRWKQALLALISYIFYGWTNPWFILIMMFSTVVDYICGLLVLGRLKIFNKNITNPNDAPHKIGVIVSVIVNLSLLGFFKYFVFVQENINFFRVLLGKEPLSIMSIVLPIGISFYTFQSMSYTIDLYRNQARPAKSFLDFACYVSLFPQLIAGPIIRYKDLADQLSYREHTLDKFLMGIYFFVIGLAKKILLANNIGEVADAAFGAGSLVWYDAWMGVLAYAFQIYFDFSGYSDMAVGLGYMFGFKFIKNFDSPYRADSITDFWRRWHISLSTWLRDYLYIPLGGNRKGKYRTYINLAIVMLLGGLWHGAKWTFVVWGAIHGLLLAFERAIGKNSLYRAFPRPLRIMITFILILITWVFFRSDSLTSAVNYLGYMFNIKQSANSSIMLEPLIYSTANIVVFLACALIVWLCKQSWEIATSISISKSAFILALFLITLASMFTQSFNPFLYFQF